MKPLSRNITGRNCILNITIVVFLRDHLNNVVKFKKSYYIRGKSVKYVYIKRYLNYTLCAVIGF